MRGKNVEYRISLGYEFCFFLGKKGGEKVRINIEKVVGKCEERS